MSVTDTDMGFDALLAMLAEADQTDVRVGVRQDKGSQIPDGSRLTLAEIAAVNEFGSMDGRIPERSFLRSTVDQNADAYEKQLTRDLMGSGDVPGAFTRLGLQAVADVQRTMVELDDPPNAPATIARKGADNPLIDTGRLRQSIDFEVGRASR